MEAPLAIYEALIQAEFPVAAARDAAEKLEKDMNTALAIRHDLQQMDARISHDVQRLDARIERLEEKLDASVQRLDEKIDSSFQLLDEKLGSLRGEMKAGFTLIDERFVSLEQRIVTKLGALMVVLMTLTVGAIGVLPTVLR